MLLVARRSMAVGLVAVVLAFLTLFNASKAEAVIVAPIPPTVIPEAAALCVAGGPVTTVACGVGAVAVLAAGAWWAYNNQDTISNWVSGLAGGSSATTGYSSRLAAVGWPPPGDGPFDNTATGAGQFALQCIDDCYNVFQINWSALCLNSSGAISAGSGFAYGVSPPSVGTIVYPNAHICGGAGQRVIQVKWQYNGNDPDATPVTTWLAGGSWALPRAVTTTVTCRPAAGGTDTTITSSQSVTAGVDGKVASTVPHCASGYYTQHLVISDTAQAGGPTKTAVDWQVKSTATTDYPACFGSGAGTCTLRVWRGSEPCIYGDTGCMSWKAYADAGSSTYTCHWGPYTLPLSNCTILEHAYDTSYQQGTNGLPEPQPAPSSTASTGTGTFPSTGPNPQPSTSGGYQWTNPTPFPTPSASITAGTPPPAPSAPAPGSSNCLSAAWSWNPVDWVVVPVECALTWAFVPDPAVMAATQAEVSTTWDGSKAGQLMSAAFGALTPIGTIGSAESGACGLTTNFPVPGGGSIPITVLDACHAPWDTYAPWVKGFLTMAVVLGGAWSGLRIAGAAFGWNLPGRSHGGGES